MSDPGIKPYIDIGIGKPFEMLNSVVAIWTIRPTAKAQAAAKLMAAEAEGKAKLLAAKTDVEVEKIQLEAKYELQQHERMLQAKYLPAPVEADIDIEVIWEPAPAEVVVGEGRRSPFQPVEQKRLRNVQQVTVEAIKALPEHEEVSETPVDFDWTARFFENVKDISNEDMQKLWGKLLAGEIASPGKFSLRTLDVLRNLTSAEAQLFHRYLSFCNDHADILVPDNLSASCGIERSEMMRLVDCGLLLPAREAIFAGWPTVRHIPFSGRLLHIYGPPSERRFGGLIFSLTGVGRELANLRLPPVNECYLCGLLESAASCDLKAEILPADAAAKEPPSTT